MAELLFYREPTLLDRAGHAALRYAARADFGFSRHANSVPLLGAEFFEASRSLPVLFADDEQGRRFPLALLSLANGHNAQLGPDGRWTGGYTPAFVRRYPFALDGDKNVCFDRAASHFGGEGQPLFEGDAPSATLQGVIGFLREFDAEHARTREFCEALEAKALFKPFVLQVITADKQAARLGGLSSIDETKLQQLDAATVDDWFRRGWLAWIYAQLHSLGALKRLGDQLDTRAAA
jgi:hypothetical protein